MTAERAHRVPFLFVGGRLMKVTVPMIPPSPNALRWRYRNPHAYKRLREACERSLMYAVESASAHQALVKQAQEARMRVLQASLRVLASRVRPE